MKRIILAAIAMLAFACYATTSLAAITSFAVTSVTLSGGVAIVTGTKVCTKGDVVTFFDMLFQIKGPKLAISEGFTTGRTIFPPCSGGTDQWFLVNDSPIVEETRVVSPVRSTKPMMHLSVQLRFISRLPRDRNLTGESDFS